MAHASTSERPETELDRWFPFVFLHSGLALIPLVGVSATAIATCGALYVTRMFAVTGFYHRYFSHRTFKTSRVMQCIFAIAGLTCVQRGPLWWAAHHRWHHRHSDDEVDIHSPVARSFIWSHVGWLTSSQNMTTNYEAVRDFDKYPELRFLNRFDWLVPSLLWIGLFAAGAILEKFQPSLHTSGSQLLVWGFFVSTVMVFHATSSINSLSHVWGYRPFDTDDNSKNNPLLALITLGEGWHNNHHRYMFSTRQGFEWWEIDLTYYGLLVLEKMGLIWDLKPVPSSVRLSENMVAVSDRLPENAIPSPVRLSENSVSSGRLPETSVSSSGRFPEV